ncbi:TIR domain-containing protein [Rhodococcus qingshengii]|uniref:TIR domain-containing protein n=1 Tax=Rhodococcus qingshengii TaxID=334542 RepID=UPI0037C61631
MASYYTMADLRRNAGGLTASAARQSFKSFDALSGRYDIFLSHSVRDAVAIAGLRNLLLNQGLSVYVDWIDDPQLDREQVSATTAGQLRQRMQNSNALVYATSRASVQSRWMPWELGYFDGFKGADQVSICPIESSDQSVFDGQEYLGLYKVIEKVNTGRGVEPYVVNRIDRMRAESLRSFVAGQSNFISLSRS